MEEPDPSSDTSHDYDELEATVNETVTKYTSTSVVTTVKNDQDKEASVFIDAGTITHTAEKGGG